MEQRSNHQRIIGKQRLWYNEVRQYEKKLVRLLRAQQQSLLTACLLVVALLLLGGIVSHLPSPLTNTPPDSVVALDYNTFLGQVKAGNMLAVILQGDKIHGLLLVPFPNNAHRRTTLPTHTLRNDAADIAIWRHDVEMGYPPPAAVRDTMRAHSSSSSEIEPKRMIYTGLPPSNVARLLPLLLSNHVVVQMLPPEQRAAELALLWRCLTLAFFVMTLPLILAHGGRSLGSPGSSHERMTQFRKCHIRRHEPAQALRRYRRRATTATLPVATKAKVQLPEEAVTFADVAGIDEVRASLEEIVQFLRHPECVQRLGARLPRGVLLAGPPGTGKTLLAKALAGEADVPFFSLSASSFVEIFAGVGASRVRDLFTQARQAAPCVLFIDELDAVGSKRSTNLLGNDEREQTLNQLLVELDGFTSREAVIVLAATNRADRLDAALLRPGRFDRHITVSLPNRAGREAILRVHTRRTPLRKDVSLATLARLTTGMSGADLANLVNEAALAAARRDLQRLTPECFEEALARIQLGARRAVVISEAERRIIAYHEAGHALVAYHVPHADTVNRISILPHGQRLGVTQLIAEEDHYLWCRTSLRARIVVGLGGRAAEELTLGAQAITTGAEDDLQAVTDIARRMVTRWGMSERIGPFFAADNTAPSSNGTAMATLIDNEVQRLLSEGYRSAYVLLHEHRNQLTKLAEALLQHEQLDRAQFEQCMQTIGSEKK